jgi:two-component system, NarL family, response regulator DevR
MTARAVSRIERRVRILLVGGHEVVRLGLRSLLETSRWFEVVADVGSVAEAVVTAAVHRPTLVLIAGTLDEGDVERCHELRGRAHDARIVVLGEHFDVPPGLTARAGGITCLSRQLGAQSVCRALRDLATGASPATAPAPPLFPPRRNGGGRDVLALTAQERRVLQLVAYGKTNKEIGTALGLSAKTVKNYLSNAFEKLNVSRRAQAAVLFIKGYGGVTTPTRRMAG